MHLNINSLCQSVDKMTNITQLEQRNEAKLNTFIPLG